MKDDLDETLEAITAHINAGVAKVKAAQRADLERLGRPGQASGQAFVKFERSVAVMRRDLEADLLQARQLEDRPRCACCSEGSTLAGGP